MDQSAWCIGGNIWILGDGVDGAPYRLCCAPNKEATELLGSSMLGGEGHKNTGFTQAERKLEESAITYL